jgi:hypothetical protein
MPILFWLPIIFASAIMELTGTPWMSAQQLSSGPAQEAFEQESLSAMR